MKIYPGTWPLAPEQQRALTNAGISNRCCSFFFFHGAREELLPDIVGSGLGDYVEEPDEPIDDIPTETLLV